MATTLNNILSFTGLDVGVPSVQPHTLNIDGRAVPPDFVAPQRGNFTVTGDATNVAARNAAVEAALD